VKQRQQVAIPTGMVGQRPAQCGRVDVGQSRNHIGEDTDFERSKVIVVFRKRQGNLFLQAVMEGLDGAVVGFTHNSL